MISGAVFRRVFMVAAVVAVPLDSAQAYVGPGLGLGALGVVLGLLASVFLAIFAVVWYPLKRLFTKRRKVPAEDKARQQKE
jgi:hypothetical protein